MGHVPDDMEAVMPGVAVTEVAAAPSLSADTQAQFALMQRCQDGEPAAFDELVRRFQPRVFSVIRGILRNSNDIEDVAQQVFTKIYFSLLRFNYRSAVATWIYKITVNECYDHLRKMKVRKASILADLSEEESARIENLDVNALSGIAGLERQLEMRDLAAKLLARVSPEDRVLLVLKEIEGYSVQDVAEILDLNQNTVKVRLFRARQALMMALKRRRV